MRTDGWVRGSAGFLAMLLLGLLAVGGCSLPQGEREPPLMRGTETREPVPRPAPRRLPRLVGMDVQDAGEWLTARRLVVLVRIPAWGLRVGDELVPGKRADRATLESPQAKGRLVPFETARWAHVVASQEPTAGALTGREMTVTLTVGAHRGTRAELAWYGNHKDSVKKHGAQACFDCHRETYCSGCHVRGIGEDGERSDPTKNPPGMNPDIP